MSELFKDPFLYINWGAAILGILLLRKYRREVREDIQNGRPLSEVIEKLCYLTIIMVSTLYISWMAGNVSLEKLGLLK